MSGRRLVIFGWSESVHVQRWVHGLTKRGYNIRVVTAGGSPIDKIDTVVLPRSSKLSYFTQARNAVRVAREFNPDIVHAHYAAGFGYWLARCDFCPTVLSVWGADIIDFPNNPLGSWLVKRALRSADAITATSDLLRRKSLELLPTCEPRLSVIPFGVEIPETICDPPDDGFVRLCYIKAHRYKYGPENLLRAMAKAYKSMPNLRLSMAGEGDLTPRLKELTSELGLDEVVEFTGFIPNKKIGQFLQRHDIMVMPSVMESESFGVAVLEASANRRPVIASDVGGVPEVLKDEQTGLLVPPDDIDLLTAAILRLASEPDLRSEFGRNGREFVRSQYAWDHCLDLMADLYERLTYDTQK